jgi:flagellar biosynthesis protein FliR
MEELIGSQDVQGSLILALLVLARIAPLVILVPFLGGSSLSASVRVVVALALVAVIYPSAVDGAAPVALDLAAVLLLGLKEVVVGVSLGLLAAMGFHLLGMAGQLIDQTRGSVLLLADPMSGESQSPLASLHMQLGVVLFLIIGGHRSFLVALAGSYAVVPLTTLPLSAPGFQAGALNVSWLFGAAFAGALLLAAPAVVALLVTDLVMGVLDRSAPGLGASLAVAPLRATLGLAMVLLALSLFLRDYLQELSAVGALVEQAAGALGASP